jgi:hypothetical protein
MVVLRSPGVLVREKDLTNGRADITNANIAGYAAPFLKGPIGEAVTVSNESELIASFGQPTAANAEYWLSGTNFLNYGGTLSVVRTDSDELFNSVARVGSSITSISLTNPDTHGKYVSAPAVTFQGGGGSGASANAILDPNGSGKVVGFNIINTGSGYTSAPAVQIAPVGTSALVNAAQGTTATATTAAGNVDAGGLVGNANITNAGSGYSSVPDITVSGGGGNGGVATPTVVDGEITSIALSGGTGYTSAPSLTIDPPTGIVVTVTSPGSNYDPAGNYTVNVSGGSPVGNATFTGTLVVSQSGEVTDVSVADNADYGNYTAFANLTPIVPAPGTTALATATIAASPIKIARPEVYEASYSGNINGWLYASKSAGSWGNSLRVCTIDHGPQQSLYFTSAPAAPAVGTYITSGTKKGKVIDSSTGKDSNLVVHVVLVDSLNNDVYLPSPSVAQQFANADAVTMGGQAYALKASGGVDDGTEWYLNKELYEGSGVKWNTVAARPRTSDDAEQFYGNANAYDSIHVAVVDEDGLISGAKNTILETFTYVSKANDGRGAQGGSNYYKKVVSSSSDYVYVGDTIFAYQAKTLPFEPVGTNSYSLSGGADYNSLTNGQFDVTVTELTNAYDIFADTDNVSIDYLIMGPGLDSETGTRQKLNYIAGIAANRKDCIAFGSAHKGNIVSDDGSALSNVEIRTNLKNFYSQVGSNSYLVIDGNYKYVYDRWNDVYRYIPCNTDVAGLVADTAIRNEPWFSPAGFSRGGIRNLAKLAWNPGKEDRDELYANRINPIAVFPGQGAVLFGDKTALSNPSAFDRINVRKLFLVVEKAIEQAAKAQLFEINDETTRNIFRSIVEPFLRDVQARRGITDFLVVCDETNNTPIVVDNNEFVAEIYIQPARSINFITLTFTATRTGISFDEIIGR